MSPYSITREDGTADAMALQDALNVLRASAYWDSPTAERLRQLRDSIEEQAKPAIQEPTGDVIVFVGGEYWQRDADTEDSWIGSYDRTHATWRELTATRHEVEIYRREEYDHSLQQLRDILFRSPSGEMTNREGADAYKALRADLGRLLAGCKP